MGESPWRGVNLLVWDFLMETCSPFPATLNSKSKLPSMGVWIGKIWLQVRYTHLQAIGA